MTTNLFKHPLNWAERILRELKGRPQSPEKPYVFLTSCMGAEGRDTTAMRLEANEASLEELEHNCDLQSFKDVLGYTPGGLELHADHHVTYYRSRYRGTLCYYLEHSAIEYIWVNARNWKAERVKSILDRAGIEVYASEVSGG